MTLLDFVRKLNELNEADTIYAAEPWTENSTAISIPEPAAGELPAEAEKLGLKYFMEVFIARDFLDDWAPNFGREPTLHQKCTRLIEYAINDA